MKKTKLMLEVEERIGEPIDVILRKWYVDNEKEGHEISELLEVSTHSVYRWLEKLGIEKRPSNSIVWTPESINRAYDKLMRDLGREPKWKEFSEAFSGALKAIIRGCYNENIRSWGAYKIHRRDDPEWEPTMKKTKKMLDIEERIGEPIENFLRRECIENVRSYSEIGEALKISGGCARNWLNGFDIERPSGVKKTKKMLEIEERIGEPIEDFLRREHYENERSIPEIVEILKAPAYNIYRWLKRLDIERRPPKIMEKTKKMLEIEGQIGESIEVFLRREYVENEKSGSEIGESLRIVYSCVYNWLRRFGIERRPSHIIFWTPERIDKRYDEMRKRLGRGPTYTEFEKECRGALAAVVEGRYDENIYSWSEYVVHRSRDEVKELFLEFVGGL